MTCTPSVLIYLSSIPFWDVLKYCPASKNKSNSFNNFSIISLLYFQNYLKRKVTNILKNQSNWGTFLVALLRITLKKKKLINLFKSSFVNLYIFIKKTR